MSHILVTFSPRIVLHAKIMKLKAILVVRRIVSWQILRINKYVCAVHSFYMSVHVWFDAMHVFAFAHVDHMHVTCK